MTSIRSRFVVIAAACLLPLLAVTTFLLIQSVSNGREQMLQAQASSAEVVAQVVGSTLSENQAVLAELANSDRIRKLEAAPAGEVLDQFKRARPSLYGLFLMRTDGSVLAYSGIDPATLPVTPSFASAIERAAMLAEPGVSSLIPVPESAAIALTAPVASKDQEEGKPIAVVGSLLSVVRLKDQVLPFVRGDSIIAVVADGQVIAAQGGGLDDQQLTEQLAEPMAQAMSGSVGSGEFSFADGSRHLAAFSPVPGVNWAVLVTHPVPSAYQANRALLERGLLALGLATLATLALVLLLGEWIARPLRALTEQAEAVNEGDLTLRPAPGGAREITELGTAIQGLTSTIVRQVDELDRAKLDGEAQAVQMRELNRRTVRLQEDERRRLAGDIHDAVSPLITGALYQARAMQMSGQAGNGNGNGHHRLDEEQQAELASINDLLGRATDELHNVVFALRPPDLDDIGVVAAIERHMADVRRSGLHCDLEVVGEAPVLTPEVRLALYRIAQEALHNALRHSSADHATVVIESCPEFIRMTIHDNGAGFDLESPGPATGLGLLSMRERAASIGATCTITSRPGDGTTIVIDRPNDVPVGDGDGDPSIGTPEAGSAA